MSCDRTQHLGAFHDGELPPALRADLQAHLAACADCRRELAALQHLSVTMAAAPLAQPSQMTLARLQALPWSQERAVRRLAGWMTAAAALVLAFTLWQHAATTDFGSPILAVDLASAADDEPPPPTLTVARWMATDLALASSTGGGQ